MTSSLPRALVPALAAAVIVSGMLAGCSTGGFASPGGGAKSAGASASPHPGSSKPAATKPSATKPAAKTAFTIPSTCLSASEVSNLLGQPEAGPTVTANPGELICEYLTATQDGAIINYQTKPGASPDALKQQADNPPAGATLTPIPGLADAAYELKTAEGDGILMLAGNTLITIAGGQTTRDRVIALAVDVLAG